MRGRERLLIVDDDSTELTLLRHILDERYQVMTATSVNAAQAILQREPVDIVMTDIHLCDNPFQNSYEGFQLVESINRDHPEVLKLVITSDPKMSTYRRAMQLGVGHALKKPILGVDDVEVAIQMARDRKAWMLREKAFDGEFKLPPDLQERCADGLVLDEKIRKLCLQVARSRRLALVISGPTGTGKEELAKLIHKKRQEAEGPLPFVPVNCGNLDENLAVDMLFGHRKGAFTGAQYSTNGFIGEANGGILFLDEVHALPVHCQQRLLRVLNDGSYQRVGESKTCYSEFQVITASTKNLDDLVEAQKFLPDLKHRITSLEVALPPLTERIDDLDALIPLFFAKQKVNVDPWEVKAIISRCKGYDWPGNIRQLYKVLETTTILASLAEEPILASKLPAFKPARSQPSPTSAPVSMPGMNDPDLRALLDSLQRDMPLRDAVENYEKIFLTRALQRHRFVGDVADALEIARSTLDQKRKKYGI